MKWIIMLLITCEQMRGGGYWEGEGWGGRGGMIP